jgi:hypothetical protein
MTADSENCCCFGAAVRSKYSLIRTEFQLTIYSKPSPGVNMTANAHVASIVTQATAYIPDSDLRRVLLDVAWYARSLETELLSGRRPPSPPALTKVDSPPQPTVIQQEGDDPRLINVLTERFDRFTLGSDRQRYFGMSSRLGLINTANNVKEMFFSDPSLPKDVPPPTKRAQFWASPVSN